MNIPLNIDWQQILLHFFNFSILTGGLYLLLFKPVKDFMNKREQIYQQMDAQAKQTQAQAQQLKAQAEERLTQLDQELDSKRAAAAQEADLYAQKQRQAAQQQADQIVANARTLAEQEGKKIVAQANRDAVAIVEQSMDKLVADRTAQAYDAFLNSAEEGSGHAQQRS